MSDWNLIEHLRRQMAFSRATYGPGERTMAVCDHIQKELREIVDGPDDGCRSREWIDVVILALDGLWRALEAEGYDWQDIPERAALFLRYKQSKNEQREWPDWRTAPKHKAIEHVRTLATPAPEALAAIRREAAAEMRERAANVALNACLVEPDGGAPTEAECLVCEKAWRRIRALPLPGDDAAEEGDG